MGYRKILECAIRARPVYQVNPVTSIVRLEQIRLFHAPRRANAGISRIAQSKCRYFNNRAEQIFYASCRAYAGISRIAQSTYRYFAHHSDQVFHALRRANI